MHIKDIVNYVKNEINFSREFCEDNVFVTLRIEPIERIIENLEQKDKDLLEITVKHNSLITELKEEIVYNNFKETECLEDKGRYYYAQEILKLLGE